MGLAGSARAHTPNGMPNCASCADRSRASCGRFCGGEAAHPLELGLRLHESVCREKTPPVLARAMCASPFDAALHDAVGIALGRSAFDFYREPMPLPSADPHFLDHNAAAAIARAIRRPEAEPARLVPGRQG